MSSSSPTALPSASPYVSPTSSSPSSTPSDYLWVSEPLPDKMDDSYFDYNPYSSHGPSKWDKGEDAPSSLALSWLRKSWNMLLVTDPLSDVASTSSFLTLFTLASATAAASKITMLRSDCSCLDTKLARPLKPAQTDGPSNSSGRVLPLLTPIVIINSSICVLLCWWYDLACDTFCWATSHPSLSALLVFVRYSSMPVNRSSAPDETLVSKGDLFKGLVVFQ
jgi:hypothetical protein